MASHVYTIPKSYRYTSDKTIKCDFVAEHGLIQKIAKLTWAINDREAYEGKEFELAYKSLKEAGWTANYSKESLEKIYWDVSENAELVAVEDFNDIDHCKVEL